MAAPGQGPLVQAVPVQESRSESFHPNRNRSRTAARSDEYCPMQGAYDLESFPLKNSEGRSLFEMSYVLQT
jgi:hypothetical protein